VEILLPRVAGLDVHQATVVAHVRLVVPGEKPKLTTRTFSTFPGELRALRDWLTERGVTHLAMEATGVYWIPVYEALEGHFDLTVCNAHHIKKVPGRKTDVSDAAWIAQCLAAGLLRKSFVPPVEVRRVRDLTRYRVTVIQSRTTLVNQLLRGLELAGLKLASVVSDVLGKSGRAILEALAKGVRDPRQLAELTVGSLRNKRPALAAALATELPESVRWVLAQQMQHLSELEARLKAVDTQIAAALAPHQAVLELACSMDAVDVVAASGILAEISFEPGKVFPSAGHLASWGGLCPGQNESGGKTKSSKPRRGNVYLKRLLVQVAWSATRMKKSRWAGLFRKLVARRGKKRALMAVAHRILEVLYLVLSRKQPYRPMEPATLPEKVRERVARRHIHQLQALGFEVSLSEKVPNRETPESAMA
jgi:transposase